MAIETLPLRRLVVCASGLVYWGGVVLQARRVRKHIGHSPNLKPRGAKEKALWFGWFVVILAWIGQPLLAGVAGASAGWDSWSWLVCPAGFGAGLVLVGAGYAGTLWSYAALGDSWRIGVNAKEKTALVSGGPYRWVRHPIYALQILMLLGAALLLPTPISLAALTTHFICVLIKARDEERHCLAVHGAAYRDYLRRTGKLFPRWLRRRPPA